MEAQTTPTDPLALLRAAMKPIVASALSELLAQPQQPKQEQEQQAGTAA